MIGYGSLALLAVAIPPQGDAAPCSAAEYRQMDFWVGDWVVIDRQSGQAVGESRIELLYDGCVLRENWASAGFLGGSLTGYWKADGKWHQTWVDQTGALRQFAGGLDAYGRMVLVARQPAPGAATTLVRMTFTANADGTVRQYSDLSQDGGATWRTRYDFLYTRPEG